MIPIKPIVIEPSGNDGPGMSTSSPPPMPSDSDLTIPYSDNGGVPPNRDDQPYGLQIIEPQADVESGDTLNPKSLKVMQLTQNQKICRHFTPHKLL